MNELIAIGVALTGLIAGSITDLRTREVPDWINYGLILSGLGLALLSTFIFNDFIYIIKSLTGLIFFFILGSLLFYTGQWGGGDTKMIMGLGALIGLSIPWPFPQSISETPFLIVFLVATLVSGAAYGLIWTIFLAVKRRKECMKEVKKSLSTRKSRIIKYACIVIMVLLFAAFLINDDFYTRMSILILAIAIPFMFYLSIFVKITERVCMIKNVSPKRLTEGDWIEEEIMEKKELVFKKGKILKNKDLEKIRKISDKYYMKIKRQYMGISFLSLSKKVHVSNVKEGDFVLENPTDVKIKDNVVSKKESEELRAIGNYKFGSSIVKRKNLIFSKEFEFDENSMMEGDKLLEDLHFGEYISGPKDLGISKENIEKLIKYMNEGKIKKVTIKEGVPFVPSFLIAFIITLLLV